VSYYCYCSTVLHNTSIHPVTIYIFRQACQLIFCKYYLNNVVRPMILLHNIKIFEDTKGVFRSRKSKKDRQYNGQKKRTNNDLQNTTQKTEDGAT
jgi:hypothetical protein